MKIEIWSDILCPFCYIGKRNLETALADFGSTDSIEVVWKSFQLDPNAIPDPNKDVYTYLAEKKGQSKAWSIEAHRQVKEMAEKVGLNYNFDQTKVSNSFDAHRLIQLAKTKNLGSEAEEALFSAHFVEGKNISHFPTLIGIGESIGLDAEDLLRIFNSDIFTKEVQADMQEARQIGVTGVPFFVFDRKYGVSGAQPAEILLQYIEKAYDEWDL